MKKKIIIILSILGTILLFIGIFVFKQYYRLEISNFESKNGQEHSYHIYPGATIDSVMALLDNDYYIISYKYYYIYTL